MSDYGVDNPDMATVERGPTIIVQPRNTVYEPADVKGYTDLDCLADSYPPSTYTWIRELDNVISPVDPSTNSRYTIINGRLIISNPSTESKDDGKYQCRPVNPFGMLLSNVATLTGGCTLQRDHLLFF